MPLDYGPHNTVQRISSGSQLVSTIALCVPTWQVFCQMQCRMSGAQPDGKYDEANALFGWGDLSCIGTKAVQQNDGMATSMTRYIRPHPIPSETHLTVSHPVRFYPILSYPVPSGPVASYPVPYNPIPPFPVPSIPSHPTPIH